MSGPWIKGRKGRKRERLDPVFIQERAGLPETKSKHSTGICMKAYKMNLVPFFFLSGPFQISGRAFFWGGDNLFGRT
jgi:hypothetical protein